MGSQDDNDDKTILIMIIINFAQHSWSEAMITHSPKFAVQVHIADLAPGVAEAPGASTTLTMCGDFALLESFTKISD